MSTTTIRAEKVRSGDRVRLTSRGGPFRTVGRREEGYLHTISLGFGDANRIAVLPNTSMDIEAA